MPNREQPTKTRDRVKGEHVNAVGGGHRLGAGLHSTVFPEHAGGENNWHKGYRNGHGGSFSVTSKGRK